jgi:hypothetical protein
MDKVFDKVDVNPITAMIDFLKIAAGVTDFVVTHPKTKALLNSDIRFDLVISEISLNDGLFGECKNF